MPVRIQWPHKNRWIRIIDWVMIFICIKQYLITVLGFSTIINYIPDLVNIILIFFFLVPRLYHRGIPPQTYAVLTFLLMFGVVTLFGWVANMYSPIYLMWGIRKALRFIPLVLVVILLFTQEDLEHTIRTQYIFIIINTVICSYQFYVLGYHRDYLGGIFGIEQGANGYMILQIVLVTAYEMSGVICKKVPMWRFLVLIAACFYLAILSELKIYFVLFIVMLAASILMNKPNVRSALIIVFGIAAIWIGYLYLIRLFPDQDIFNKEYMIRYSTSAYGTIGGLSRTNAIAVINRQFFHTDSIRLLFGYGLGSCEYAAFSFLVTPFYRMYSHLNYTFFSVAITYLEMGWSGLILYVSFFIGTFLFSLKHIRSEGRKHWRMFSCLIAGVAVVMMFLNATFRGDTGYIMYFFLSIPFCIARQESAERTEDNVSDRPKRYISGVTGRASGGNRREIGGQAI